MRRSILAACAVALPTLAACAETPREVTLPPVHTAPTAQVLDGLDSGGELADARMVLGILPGWDDDTGLAEVARDSFSCWEEAAATGPVLGNEGEACRVDFWGAVHALGSSPEVAAR